MIDNRRYIYGESFGNGNIPKWGGISGDINYQLDLKRALLAKADNYTAWEVLVNTIVIPAGAVSYMGYPLAVDVNGTLYPVAVDIPVGMTETFNVYPLDKNGIDVDWGDGQWTHADTPLADSATIDFRHTYIQQGKYTIKVYGRFQRIKHTDKATNLMYRALAGDLPTSREHRSLQNFCANALRLTSVSYPSWGDFSGILSLLGTFSGCLNLRSVDGLGRFVGVISCAQTFQDCINMISCDFQLPPLVVLADDGGNGYRNTFLSTSASGYSQDAPWLLTCDLNSLFPSGGFTQDIVDISNMFYHAGSKTCYHNITLTQASAEKLALKLWNSGKTFRGYDGLFKRMPDSVRQYIPTEWGGLA